MVGRWAVTFKMVPIQGTCWLFGGRKSGNCGWFRRFCRCWKSVSLWLTCPLLPFLWGNFVAVVHISCWSPWESSTSHVEWKNKQNQRQQNCPTKTWPHGRSCQLGQNKACSWSWTSATCVFLANGLVSPYLVFLGALDESTCYIYYTDLDLVWSVFFFCGGGEVFPKGSVYTTYTYNYSWTVFVEDRATFGPHINQQMSRHWSWWTCKLREWDSMELRLNYFTSY